MSYRTAVAPVVVRPALLTVGLLLIAANLRAPITGLAPVLTLIQSSFALTPAQAGLLTTLPLVAFGVISPFAALFARQYGLERSLLGALLMIAAGIAIRSLGPLWCLFVGTVIIGAGIAVGNVLLPSLVKRDFPRKVPTVTGVCAITMGVAAALASASAIPLAHAFGWPLALAAIIVLPLVALAVWATQSGQHTAPAPGTPTPPHGGPVWHSAIAWQVMLFMGINAALYYVLIGWLPAILTSAGFTPAAAGSVHGLMQLGAAVPGLFLGPLVNRMKDQKLIAAGMGVMMGVALLGFLFAPAFSSLWACCFGVGSGGGLILALMFMSLRAGTPHQVAALSGMAQCLGYLLAACGPTLAGLAHDLSGGWAAPLAVGAGLAVVMAVFGALAGRARQIGIAHGAVRQ
jgi:CP family cyanate transporter-like MFS transporter